MKTIVTAISLLLFVSIAHTGFSQWVEKNSGLYGGVISAVATNGTKLFAATYSGGVFVSTDNGASWSPSNSGLIEYGIGALAVFGGKIFVGTRSGVFTSSDDGATWKRSNITQDYVVSFAASGSNIFACAYGRGVLLSTDGGSTWNTIGANVIGTSLILGVAASGSNVYAAKADGGIFVSTDNGATWSDAATTPLYAYLMAVNGGKLFANHGGVSISSDNGSTWTTMPFGTFDGAVTALTVYNSNVVAGTTKGSVYISYDNGQTWTSLGAGLPPAQVNSLLGTANGFITGTDAGVYTLPNGATNWAPLNNGLTLTIKALVYDGSSIFAATAGGVFKSSDRGSTWTLSNAGMTTNYVYSLNLINGILVAGTLLGTFSSSDHGASWIASSTGMPDRTYVDNLTVKDNNIFAGTVAKGVLVSSDNGATWASANVGLPNSSISVHSFAVAGTSLFALSSANGIFVSQNNGASWSAVAIPGGGSYWTITANSTNVFVGSTSGVYTTTTNGWTVASKGLPSNQMLPTSMAAFDNVIFVGTVELGPSGYYVANPSLFISSDNGSNWQSVSSLPYQKLTNCFLRVGNDLFLGTDGGGVWSTPLGDLCKPAKPIVSASINANTGATLLTSSSATGNQWYFNGNTIDGATSQTSIASQSGTYKVQVSVNGCPTSVFSDDKVLVITGDILKDQVVEIYPNPTSDVIAVSLGESGFVKEVTIYELTGRVIASQTVADSEARFQVNDFPSGIYIVRSVTGGATKTLKFLKK